MLPAALVALALCGVEPAMTQNLRAEPRVRAPSLDAADAWLNTDRPLTRADLAGRVVLLDFWTYCCINCLHTLPDLAYLEDKYRGQPFLVIGVHSGKFSREKDPQNIRQAIQRHGVRHPVAVDSDYELWDAYTVRTWPTLVLVDPDGYIVGTWSGEGHRETLDREIAALLADHRTRGTLTAAAAAATTHTDPADQPLRFPGKVLADSDARRLFISDTGRNRVVVTDFNGRIEQVIGTGRPALRDGPCADACFQSPQGLVLSADGRTLYVADTGNHALRAVDLERGQVRMLAGTGRQARTIYKHAQPAARTELSSPWDLARVGNLLFIAMAGPHQVWSLNLKDGRIRVHAGTGAEAALDGVNDRAAFAQPSGVATDGRELYVADSESSSIRSVGLKPRGRTRTLAGSGDLFGFGDADGPGPEARFQHPLGVALDDDRLFIADTFNDRIRVLDLRSGLVETWFPTGSARSAGRPDAAPGPAAPAATAPAITLSEPGGLSIAGGTLYVADTNHHRIVAIDLVTRAARVLDLTPR